MQRRKLDAHAKAMIVIEGLKGKPVAEICTEHKMSQSQYDQWRDQFPTHTANAFESHQSTKEEAPLEREDTQLKQLVGEFTFELKKGTCCWDNAASVAAGDAAG
jgi:transposase-like protein